MNNNSTPRTAHITRLFRTATPEQIAAGLDWYRDAHTFATDIAERYSVPLSVAAGVIAAVSPLQSWGANKKLAERIIAAGGLKTGYLKTGLSKADKILAGGDAATILNGEKITAFYFSILSAGQSDTVCIDRHSWSLAVNHRYSESTGDTIPSLKGKRYALAADAHRRAAVILSKEYGQAISAVQVQAVCWTLWRLKFWSVGAFDGLDD